MKRIWKPYGDEEKERWLFKATLLINQLFDRSDIVTDISSAPTAIGLVAIVSGAGYLSTGTSSSADWKQITA